MPGTNRLGFFFILAIAIGGVCFVLFRKNASKVGTSSSATAEQVIDPKVRGDVAKLNSVGKMTPKELIQNFGQPMSKEATPAGEKWRYDSASKLGSTATITIRNNHVFMVRFDK